MNRFKTLSLLLALSCSALGARADDLAVDPSVEKAAFESASIQNAIESLTLNHRINDGKEDRWPFSTEHHVNISPNALSEIASFKSALAQQLRLGPSIKVFDMSFNNYEGDVPNPKLHSGSKAAMSITFYDHDEFKYLRYNIYVDQNQKLRGIQRDIVHPARNVRKHGGGGGGDNHNIEWILIK